MKTKMVKFLIPLLLVTIAFVVLLFSFAILKHPTKPSGPVVTFEMMEENKAEARIYAEIKNVPTKLDFDDLLNSYGEIIELPSFEPSPIVLDLQSINDILHTEIVIRDAGAANPSFDVSIKVSLKILSDDGNEELLIRTILTNKISVLYLLLIDGSNNSIDCITDMQIGLVKAILSNTSDNVICYNSSCIVLGKGGDDLIKKSSTGLLNFEDKIFGGNGNDTIESLFIKKQDHLYGGPGEDTLKGKWGKNNFYSSSPNDVSIGQSDDVFSGPGQKVLIE